MKMGAEPNENRDQAAVMSGMRNKKNGNFLSASSAVSVFLLFPTTVSVLL